MGFTVVQGSPLTIWAPLDNADTSTETLYVGQLVYAASDGVLNLGTAGSTADTTNKKVPFGVVVGTNNKTPLYNSTYKTDYITSIGTMAGQLARDYRLAEGMWAKNDPQAFVQVALIDPCTVLKGQYYNAAYGTAPTLLTLTVADTTGFLSAAGTSNATQFTPVADKSTIYCRSGANKGLYRITVDTSTTQPQVDVAFPYASAVGDTFVRVPGRPVGTSFIQTDAEATYIESSTSPATNYWVVEALGMDLSVAGQECLYFRFGMDHFCLARA